MKVLGLIPARGGSKEVPRKNLRSVAGKSLLQRAIECGHEARVLDRLVVSTDDDEIEREALALGAEVPFRRPPVLATDEASMVDVVLHAVEALARLGYSPAAVAILQPTSPLRRPEHIHAAIRALGQEDAVCSVSLVPPHLSPHYVMRVDEDGHLRHFLDEGGQVIRRQDAPTAYWRNGLIYLVRVEALLETRSLYGRRCIPLSTDVGDALTVDSEADLLEATNTLRAREGRPKP